MHNTPYKLGWISDLPDFRDWPFSKRLTIPEVSNQIVVPATIPAAHRLVWAPGATDQGQLGQCVAHAGAKAVRFARMATKKYTQFEINTLFSYWNERNVHGWTEFDSGSYARTFIKVASKIGVIPENEWTTDISRFTEKPSDKCYEIAAQNKALAYFRIGWEADTSEKLLAEMKTCISEGFPFIGGISVYNDFPWDSKDGIVNLPGQSTYIVGGHLTFFMGFDDGSQRFEFANSWGYRWGKFGRGTIPYTYLTNPGLARDFWTIRVMA